MLLASAPLEIVPPIGAELRQGALGHAGEGSAHGLDAARHISPTKHLSGNANRVFPNMHLWRRRRSLKENQTVLSNRGYRRWHLFPPKKPVWRDGRQCAGGEC